MRILEEALTFDDVLLVPAYSEILPRETDLSTQITRRIRDQAERVRCAQRLDPIASAHERPDFVHSGRPMHLAGAECDIPGPVGQHGSQHAEDSLHTPSLPHGSTS